MWHDRTTLQAKFSGLGFDNTSDFSNLLGVALASMPTQSECEERCKGLNVYQRAACISLCKQGKTPEQAEREGPLGNVWARFIEPFRNILIIVIGLVLLIVALALLTK